MKYNQYITDYAALIGASFRKSCDPFSLIGVDLLKFESGLATDVQAVLSPQELLQYQKYKFPKRQREWLGGRLACKTAVARLIGSDHLPDIIVANGEHGRPFVTGPGCHGVHVSISHSGDMAMGLASHVPCGLDIQEMTSSLERVQKKFIQPAEKELLSVFQQDEVEQLGLVWVVKEAIRKQVDLVPLVGFLEMSLQRIDVVPDGYVVYCSVVEKERPLPFSLPPVYATMYNQYGLAICFEAILSLK